MFVALAKEEFVASHFQQHIRPIYCNIDFLNFQKKMLHSSFCFQFVDVNIVLPIEVPLQIVFYSLSTKRIHVSQM